MKSILNIENYLRGIPASTDGRYIIGEESAYLTEKGENDLEKNKNFARTYKVANEIRVTRNMGQIIFV